MKSNEVDVGFVWFSSAAVNVILILRLEHNYEFKFIVHFLNNRKFYNSQKFIIGL